MLFRSIKYKDFFKAQGREEQLDAALESFNYLTGLVEKGQARLVSDLYPAEAVKGHPYRSHLTGMFYQGQQGLSLIHIYMTGMNIPSRLPMLYSVRRIFIMSVLRRVTGNIISILP